MKFQEVLTISKKYTSVLFLNRILPPSVRSVIITSSCISMVIATDLLILVYAHFSFAFLPVQHRTSIVTFLTTLSSYQTILIFVAGISIILFFATYALHTYSRYFSLNSLRRVFSDNKDRSLVSYEAARVMLVSEEGGLAKALLSVPESNFIINRLLITSSDVLQYGADIRIDSEAIIPYYEETVTIGSLWKLLYENSEPLRNALLGKKIQKEIYEDTCDWLDRSLEEEKRKSAWWWRENLSKLRGIGKMLSYGGTGFMSRYSRELILTRGVHDLGTMLLHKSAIMSLEEALSKNHGANAVIVGSKGTGRHAVVQALARMIDRGDCYVEIEHKRIFEFDNDVLGSLSGEDMIRVIDRCFVEAIIARNIIFVINDMSALHEMAEQQGVNLFQSIERYIQHPDVSIVCICGQSFYQHESHKSLFDKDFEIIHIEDMSRKLLIPFIQDSAVIVERSTGTFFPAYSLNAVALALNKYFAEESPLIKANDLLYKIASSGSSSKHLILDEESVGSVIQSMTGVATGAIDVDEKEKLLNLENILHTKVMGQNEAITVVASTMRRSRAGLVSSNKPIGSFLFLGPTGVGKTETAKALAQVFFGNEDHMSRIDMNEYTMGNSSYRLLGDHNDEGDIARCVHARPYGVLLLDEFEKATTDVKDIFLRVLDEGVFTNGAGAIISARTQIIIATSNAGSNYIRESGLSAHSTKEEIEVIKNNLINTIVAEGLFRPELVNRFDAVVVFHPLGDDSRILIAQKMLEALKQRTLLQGYNVTFTDALVQKIISNEGDRMFGGRAIQRTIQTEVEEAIAKKIIEGSLGTGGSLVLDVKDLG